ncbi:MAG: T9SS C-terminal target domain-containing protein [Sphingobacteriales bacterium]|nr:MAG: T9SS C-terminal target domain-containing protein [Sphingobacteriales bacterium]
MELSSTGNILWQKEIGGNNQDVAQSIIKTNDNGVLVGGWSFSGISGNKTDDNVNQNYQTPDYWIIKLAPDSVYENSDCCLLSDNNKFSISPNPTTNEIKISNLLGQQVKNISVSNEQNHTINISDFPSGIYMLTVSNAVTVVTKKFVKE